MGDTNVGNEQSREWDRHDWAGADHPADEQAAPRWDDREYAGQAPDAPGIEHAAGGGGPTGGGHGSGEQHWVPERGA